MFNKWFLGFGTMSFQKNVVVLHVCSFLSFIFAEKMIRRRRVQLTSKTYAQILMFLVYILRF